MPRNKEKRENRVAEGGFRKKKATRISVFAILATIALFLILIGGYSIGYSSKVLYNVSFGETNVSGKNKVTLGELIKKQSEDFLKQKFVLNYKPESGEEKKYEIMPADIGLVFGIENSTDQIYGYGRAGNAWKNFTEQFMSLLKPHRFLAIYTINQEALNKKISDISAETDTPEKDYEISYAGGGSFELKTEKQTGKRIDQQGLINNLKSQISNLKIAEVGFSNNTYEPKVTESNAKNRLADANQILAQGELNLVYADQKYSLDVDTLGGLIKSRPKSDDLDLYIDQAKAKTQIEAIAIDINQDPKNAVLSVANGTVSAFQQAQVGRVLDQEQAVIDISNALFSRITDGVTSVKTASVMLKVKETKPEITSDQIASYGLKELVATGTTDFRKSPSNRVHNIAVGATAINGTLIKPGEEFSTLGKLGDIDASTGYLPELVIKNNKTVPDYGGGLCQVSTTLFRAALNAGMKITSRQNHSYRVSYYEPPIGMDATIFDPSPDFKFINNYASYILIQSHIEGTKITFDFYGTKDTRVVNIGAAAGYDYVEPPAAIYTVDATLPPATENLVSHAHQGASAKFHYEVTRDGETLQAIDFLSKYVALPEIWMVSSDSAHAPQPEIPPAPPADPAAVPPA